MHSPLASPPPPPPLGTQLNTLNPPEDIQKALLKLTDARRRLTLQLYYATPHFFSDVTSSDKDRSDIAILPNEKLISAVGYIVFCKRTATYPAARVLIGNEILAVSTIIDWLLAISCEEASWKANEEKLRALIAAITSALFVAEILRDTYRDLGRAITGFRAV